MGIKKNFVPNKIHQLDSLSHETRYWLKKIEEIGLSQTVMTDTIKTHNIEKSIHSSLLSESKNGRTIYIIFLF